ncbi:MAG: Ig-like domain-containing protein [Burkholderiaceae bacterium]|nr:Ig-like domain-containing protein [Burkholderiaceae bacterium]
MASPTALTTVQKLYIAYYGRAADAAGQLYWADTLDISEGSLVGIIDAFANAPEAQSLYGHGTTVADRITVLYQNILGRTPDPTGLSYYVNEVSSGRLSLGTAALAILEGVQGADKTLADNRLNVANTFTSQISSAPNSYESEAAAAIARTFLKQVTTDPASLGQTNAQLPAYLNTIAVASRQPAKFAYLVANGLLISTAIVSTTLTEANLDAAIQALPSAILNIAITSATGIQNGTLNTGDVVNVMFTMREPTTIAGAPELALNIGGMAVPASYVSGSGSRALLFSYTIQAGQNDNDGIAIGANSLRLNNATFKDAKGNNVLLTNGAVADNPGYKVDTRPPSLNITDKIVGAATEPVVFTFTFSEPVLGFTSEAVTVSNGTKGALSGSGSTYTLTVTPKPNSTGTTKVTVASQTIQDLAGHSGATASAEQVFDTRIAVDLLDIAAGDGGFVLYGQAAGDQSGTSVSAAGDVNGDGLGDFLIGAPFSDPAIGKDAGRSYLVFGKGTTTAVDLNAVAAGNGGFVINGQAAGDQNGGAVHAVGDVNGDGLADFIVGVPLADPAIGKDAGRSYVVFGKNTNTAVDLTTVAAGGGGFVINGQAVGEQSGLSVGAAGDVNGDGLADLLIGAAKSDPSAGLDAGRSYVVFGKSTTTPVELAAIAVGSGGFVIHGQVAGDQSGFSVSAAGDVNGDGRGDLVIGALNGDPSAKANAGRSYVVFGKGAPTAVDLATIADGNGGFVINGQAAGDQSGWSVSAAGDVNGDGLADLVIGAPNSDPATKTNAGRSYVIFGKTSSTAIDLTAVVDGNGGFVIDGQAAGDQSGWNVSAAGDVNGDGLADLIVGAPLSDPAAGKDAGRSYVVFGKGTTTAVDLTAIAAGNGGFVINGQASDDSSGATASAAGDVNGDGLADLLIGARSSDPNLMASAGRSYVVFGSLIGAFQKTAVDTLGTVGDDALADKGLAQTLVGQAGNDHFTATAASVLYGGNGDDHFVIGSAMLTALQAPLGSAGNLGQLARIDGGSGMDTVHLHGNGLTLDLTQIANQAASNPGGGSRLDSIERIDMVGGGSNTLLLDARDVIDMVGFNSFEATGRRQLLVDGDAADTLAFTDAGWSSAGTVTLVGTGYTVYNHANAFVTVYVTSGLNVV